MTDTVRWRGSAGACRRALPALLGVVAACAGCAEKGPAVFDKPGIDQIHKLLVLPLQSPQEPAAGPIVSGMIAADLQRARLPKLAVIEPPALWRLRPAAAPAGDEAAMKLARDMGADAVLTGIAGYSVVLATDSGMPGATQESMKALEFQRSFAARQGASAINVRILSVTVNRAVYAHTASTSGLGTSKLLAEGARKAVKPLVDYLRRSRKK